MGESTVLDEAEGGVKSSRDDVDKLSALDTVAETASLEEIVPEAYEV